MPKTCSLLPLLLFCGCGSKGSSAGSGAAALLGSCSTVDAKNAQYQCQDYAWTGASATDALSQVKVLCKGSSGTYTSTWTDAACNRTGAVGGCDATTTVGDLSEHNISWYYTGTVAKVQAACSETKINGVTPTFVPGS